MFAKHRQNGDDMLMDKQKPESKSMASEHIDDNEVAAHGTCHPHVIGGIRHMGKERSHAQQSLQEFQS